MTTVESGQHRQMWFAPISGADPLDPVDSFLTREDSFSEQSATIPKSIRLGEQVDTGPYSTWSQQTWIGGQGQEFFSDKQMYWYGQGNVSDKPGRWKYWPSWKKCGLQVNNAANVRPEILYVGPTNNGTDVPLYATFSNASMWTYVPSGSLWQQINGPVAGLFHGPITAMCHLGQDEGVATDTYIAFGDSTGRFYYMDAPTSTVVVEGAPSPGAGAGYAKGITAMVDYNFATYVAYKDEFKKRTYTGGGGVVWTAVRQIPDVEKIVSMVVWQGKIWMLGHCRGDRARVYTTDGSAVVFAFEIQNINCTAMQNGSALRVHYGSLYIAGNEPVYNADDSGAIRGVVYKYNGSSLTRLHDRRNPDLWGTADNYIRAMDTWGKYLVWTVDQNPSAATYGGVARNAGVELYDPENDAIVPGPDIMCEGRSVTKTSGQGQVRGMCAWGATLAVGLYDDYAYNPGTLDKPWVVAYMRRGGAVRPSGITGLYNRSWQYEGDQPKKQTLVSSYFDADLPGETKVLLYLQLRYKLPYNDGIKVIIEGDKNATSWTVVDVTGPGTYDDDWHTWSIPLRDAATDVHLSASRFRYRIELSQNNTVDTTTKAPQIEGVTTFFNVAPGSRRQWRIRFVLHDGQERLDGSANPLTTRVAQADKLREYWSNGMPFKMWDARADGDTPTGNGVTVVMTDFTEQPYRVTSGDSVVASEVSCTLVEIPLS